MFANPRLAAAAIASAVLVAACAATSSRQTTAEALTGILAADYRPQENRARDRYRHPKETLLFFGIRPEMSVLEVWPEPGWYTEVIAPLVRDKGKYYAAVIAADPESTYISQRLDKYHHKLAERPDLYGRVSVVSFPADGSDAVPPASVDMVVTFRNIHNWMSRDTAAPALTTMYRALKPGGVLGVVEHRGNPAVAQDPKAKSGYVNEDYAIRLIEAQGFRLVAKSQVNANPKDTKDYEQGVWTLPPTYRLGDKDRDKYAAIGESDRFTVRFVKPLKKSSPHIAQPGTDVHCHRRAALAQSVAAGEPRSVEGHGVERLVHLLGHEAAASAVHVRICLPRLVREMKLERHDSEQVVLRAGERDIQQPPLLLDELRPAGGELGREAAIHDVQHVDGVPLHAFRRVDRRQHQVVLIERRAAGEVTGGVRRIECELGEEAFARRILPR